MNMEYIKEVFFDKDFDRTLAAMETVEEVQEALAQKGIQIPKEKLIVIREYMSKAKSERGGTELNETELEQVAGGGSFWDFLCETLGSIGV